MDLYDENYGNDYDPDAPLSDSRPRHRISQMIVGTLAGVFALGAAVGFVFSLSDGNSVKAVACAITCISLFFISYHNFTARRSW